MLRSLTLVQAPTTEPITLAQLKAHLRVAASFTDDDALLSSYIAAARAYAERYTRRAFMPQRWRLGLDHFPQTYQMPSTVSPNLRRDWPFYAGIWTQSTIALPKPRVNSVDSITYVDGSGTTQTLDPSAYITDLDSEPARIVPGPGLYWPTVTAYLPGSVKITYTSGDYAEASDCPQDICVALLLLCAHWYAHPEAAGGQLVEMPFAVSALLRGYRCDVLDYDSVV